MFEYAVGTFMTGPIIISVMCGVLLGALLTLICFKIFAKKTELKFLNRHWSDRKELLKAALMSDENLIAYDKAIYGDHKVDLEDVRIRCVCALKLEGIFGIWNGMKDKTISVSEGKDNIAGTLTMLRRRPKLVAYLLDTQGYPKAFKNFVAKQFEKSEAIEMPNFKLSEEFDPEVDKNIRKLLNV